MPIRLFKCPKCENEMRSFKDAPECIHEDSPVVMEEVLTTPQTKFMEKSHHDKNKSVMVGQKKILKARARDHSRDRELHDIIQTHGLGMAQTSGWLNKDGKRRTKMDDI